MSERIVFREYERPEGIELDGCWKVEQLWGGMETDTLYSVRESDAGDLIGAMLLDQYEVRVTWPKPHNTVQTYAQA